MLYALLAALLLALGGAAGAWGGRVLWLGPGPLAAETEFVVPRAPTAELALSLHAAGIVANPFAFRLATLATQREGTLHSAEFAFPAHASLRQVLSILRTARPVQHRLTIPEGLTAAQIAALLGRTPALAGDEVVPAEGALLPETYSFERDTPRATLAARASAAMDRALAQVWEERDPKLALASPRELLILASIVERETARPEERAHMAGVFLNRLRLGMKLQSDPTVIYAVSGGAGQLDRPLSHADLDGPNPYNTYRSPGLPPGPICSPGLATLRAVAHPLATDDLYFVADGHGGHAFARTLDEHNRNVARWRALAP